MRQDKFLAVFAGVCTIAGACRLLATKKKKKFEFTTSKETVRLWRRDDLAFEARFQATKANVEELLADSTLDDALGDWSEEKHRFVAGNPILKIFLLKALNPEKYRDQFKVEHGGMLKVGAISAMKDMSKAELLKLAFAAS